MPRHLSVRNREDSFTEEFETNQYGLAASVEDNQYDWPASPSTAQFLYSRNNVASSLSGYVKNLESKQEPRIPEETNQNDSENDSNEDDHYDDDDDEMSHSFNVYSLSSGDQERLKAALVQVQNVVGDQYTESVISRILVQNDYNLDLTIENLISSPRNSEKKSTMFFGPSSTSSSSAAMEPPINRANGDQSKRTLNFDHLTITDSKSKPVITSTSSQLSAEVEQKTDKGQLAIANAPVHYDSQFSRSSATQHGATKNGVNNTDSTAASNEEPVAVIDEKTKALLMEETKKPTISVVVIGHVDAGKSTLVGHLLYKIGSVSKKELSKFEQESKKEGKSSFALAWVMDENANERSRGVTMEISERFFETEKYFVTIVDAPGHKDFIPAMITGTSEADVAVLVVDASVNAFESGFNAKDISLGQTSEHSVLARSLGVTSLIVAVNKIDTCPSPEARLKEIESILIPFLTKKAGYKPDDITFIPCSGFYGKNIKDRGDLDWYSGPTLLEAIDNMPIPARPTEQPFCMAITDTIKVSSNNATVSGLIKCGYVKHNDKVLLQPANVSAVLKGIKVLDKTSNSASAAGTNAIAVAGSHIHCVLNVDASSIVPGSFVCAQNSTQPMLVTTTFHARLVTFNTDEIIMRGSAAEMHYISLQEPVFIKKIVGLLDKSGEVVKKNPKFVPKNASAIVVVSLQRTICVQLFKKCKILGRFMLRLNGATVAAGIIDQVP